MNIEDDSKILLKFGIISILIFLIIISLLILNNNQINTAYIHQEYLDNEWFENLEYRNIETQFFGLEKWISIRYELKSNYTNYLILTTIKTIVLFDEKELSNRIEDIIDSMLDKGTLLDENSKISGERFLKNGHKSIYNIFEGVNTLERPNEKVRIIAEIWNCGFECKTIICLGYSQITDALHNNMSINSENWEKIVGDKKGTFGDGYYIRDDGLIYNVICH